MDRRQMALAASTAALISLPGHAALARPAGCPGADRAPRTTDAHTIKHAVRCLIDRERARHGLGRVHPAPRLGSAAHGHATAMVRHGYFSHYGRSGRGPAERARAAGYMRGAADWRLGEDIGWGERWLATPRRIVAAFMASPPHREVILTRGYRALGIGVSVGVPGRGRRSGGTYVLDFGARG